MAGSDKDPFTCFVFYVYFMCLSRYVGGALDMFSCPSRYAEIDDLLAAGFWGCKTLVRTADLCVYLCLMYLSIEYMAVLEMCVSSLPRHVGIHKFSAFC